MALIVEDGSGVAGANSYVSVADAKVWAGARGLTLPSADADIEKLIVKAMDLVESYRSRFSGSKTDSAQALQWPRTGASLDGAELDDDVIPTELKSAVYQLAFEAQSTDLQPTGSGQEVLREKVDVIETEYAKRGSGSVTPQFNKAMAFLEPLFKGGGMSIRTLRV